VSWIVAISFLFCLFSAMEAGIARFWSFSAVEQKLALQDLGVFCR
jgi:hypothetical protein